MVKSILLVGVGGQGTILTSKILTYGLCEKGFDVKMSEIHGMSQRGGSVSTQIRYGDRVNSPVIGPGEADILISFEEMETYRWLSYLKPGGKVVLNDYRIPSAPILIGAEKYPENLKEEISALAPTKIIKAADKAMEIGAPRAMNIVLLGALVVEMGLLDIDWEHIIRKTVKPQFIEMNLTALHAGMKLVEGELL